MVYQKILKETASQLTLLIAGDNTTLEKSLYGYFKQIHHAKNIQESVALYRQQRTDLVIIHVDTLGDDTYGLIDEIKKLDGLYASIVVYGSVNTDCKLLNANVDGFLSGELATNDMYEVLGKICDQTLDKQAMHTYLREIEVLSQAIANTQRVNPLTLAHTKYLNSDAIFHDEMAASVSNNLLAPAISTTSIVEEDDDFEFFPLFEESFDSPCLEIDNSMYEDYYSYLEHDDKEELTDQLNEIDATLYNAFSDDGANVHYISRLGSSLMRYGNVLLHYQFFSDMGTSILELGKLIIDECDHVVGEAKNFELLVSAFCSGLQTFMAEVWENNSENPKLFNDSILSDTRTIVAMFTPAVAADDSDDLIFF